MAAVTAPAVAAKPGPEGGRLFGGVVIVGLMVGTFACEPATGTVVDVGMKFEKAGGTETVIP
jgi:hypothetical protein